ncbi:sulfatase [Seonamhaeicola marinus]|uniref:Sulfatase n=1 Tax=Seonamhaeicola marinus TaxID=1912246 RepID=A0A5D0HSR8_9FLAO|nr:sulfatase [Seonamhaeicola marinus]TYA74364.1 sulfatase [Seonamhaeicola marinus]
MSIKTVFSFLCVSTILLSACNQKTAQPEQQPNVLFILVDDLGLNDLGYTGSTFYETPNIDKLAEQSTVFTQGYANCRVCSPSRASIFTGKFTARHGITDWIGAKSGEAWRERKRYDKLLPAAYNRNLPHDDISLAEAMKNAGYNTFFAGKWHLGDKGSHPEDHGFNINIGGYESGGPRGGYYSPWNNPKLPNLHDGENLSMRLAKETSNFIKSNSAKPFFAFLSFYAVHGPIETTQEKWQKYRDKAASKGIDSTGYKMERVLPIRTVQDNPIYAGLVETTDDAVGLILNTLKELGIDDNTIVVFTSDNGGVASGDAYSTSNLPLRGGKGYQWEGGIREPYLIKAPGIASGEVNYPVMGSDFYPTLLDLTGINLLPEQHVDGVSLKPVLEDKSFKMADRPLYWHYPHYGNQGGEPSSIIRENHWKLIHYWEDGRNELYNLETDPSEQTNLANTNTELVNTLETKLTNWLESVGAKFPEQDPEYDAAKDKARDEQIANKLWPNKEKERLKFLAEDFEPNASWWQSKVTKD